MGDTPHIPRHPPEADRPCNPFLAFADQTSSPVVDPRWCDPPRRTPLAAQVPLNLKFARVQFRTTIGWADILPRGSKPGVAGDTGGTVGAGRRRMLGVLTVG